jgi:hypothetical protein
MQEYAPHVWNWAFAESRRCFGELEDWMVSEEAACGVQNSATVCDQGF